MKYRPDIDGLRAVAVLPVVLFHAKVPWLSGGYVGVDIFFVISGFLITSIILPDIEAGTFTITGFYERRIRRIFPALFVMMAMTLLVAWFLVLPDDFRNLTDSTVATLVFASNIFFHLDSGYFSGPAEAKPLLHTWSLAVEEQFYIFWPFLLMLAIRVFRSSLPTILLVLSGISFAVGQYLVMYHPDAAFYLLPSRAWELFVGAVLAVGFLPAARSQRHADAASVLGAAMILIAVLGFTARTPFPGASALLPCVGAALIIWAGSAHTSLVCRVLSLKSVVFVGLISYSLYLWHWPVFVLAKYAGGRELEAGEYLLLIGLAFALATLSLNYIETPLRRRKGGVPLPNLIGALSAVVAVIVAIEVYSHATDGIPGRLPATAVAYLAGKEDFGIVGDECLNRDLDRIKAGDLCRFGKPNGKPKVRFLLWGDSHAEAMAPAFSHLAEKYGADGWYASRDACPPLLGVAQWPLKRKRECPRFIEVMHAFLQKNKITDVILVARWNLYSQGWPRQGLDSAEKQQFFIHDSETKSVSTDENKKVLMRGLRRTVSTLTREGYRVWVVEQVPYVGFRVPSEYAIAEVSPFSNPRPGPESGDHNKRAAFVRQTLESLRKEFDFRALNAAAPLCLKNECLVFGDGRPLYRDDDHLSGHGARWIASALRPIFEQ